MKLLLYIMFNLLLSYKNVILARHRSLNIFKKNSFKMRENIELKNVKDLYACGSLSCQIIEEFTISQNNTFNCNEQNIGIEFYLYTANKSKEAMFGYISTGYRARILDQQSYSKTCMRLKRLRLYHLTLDKENYLIFFMLGTSSMNIFHLLFLTTVLMLSMKLRKKNS